MEFDEARDQYRQDLVNSAAWLMDAESTSEMTVVETLPAGARIMIKVEVLPPIMSQQEVAARDDQDADVRPEQIRYDGE
jgi:hypothetical protein